MISNTKTKKNKDRTTQEKYNLYLKNLALQKVNIDLQLLDPNKRLVLKNGQLETEIEKLDIADFQSSQINFKGSYLAFEESSLPNMGRFDSKNIRIHEPHVKLEKLKYTPESTQLQLSTMKGYEASGFKILHSSAFLNYSKDSLKIEKLKFVTPLSKITGNALAILPKESKLNISWELDTVNLQVSEALYFDPALSKNPYFQPYVKDKILGISTGSYSNDYLNLKNLNLEIPKKAKASISGNIRNLTNPTLDIRIAKAFFKKEVLQAFVKTSSLDLPQDISIKGDVSGNLESLKTHLYTQSNQGKANYSGNIQLKNQYVEGMLHTDGYKVGELLKNKEIGSVNTDMHLKLRNFDDPHLTVKGKIQKATYQNKEYKNIDLDGTWENKVFTSTITSQMQGAEATFTSRIDLRNPEIEIKGKTHIQSLDLKTLGYTTENITLSGDMNIEKFKWDPHSPEIDLNGENLLIHFQGKKIDLSQINIVAHSNDDRSKILKIKGPFFDLHGKGKFDYSTLLSDVMDEIHTHYNLANYTPKNNPSSNEIALSGTVSYDNTIHDFAPQIQNFKPVAFNLLYKKNSSNPLKGNVAIPMANIDSFAVKNTTLLFQSSSTGILYNLATLEAASPTFRVRNASLEGNIAKNEIDFNLSVKDSLQKKIHALSGILLQTQEGIRVKLSESGTLLSYEPWSGNPYGYFDYTSKGMHFNDIVFSKNEQIVRVNSLNDEPNGPINVFAENIDLAFISKSFLRDSILVGGEAHLDLEVLNYAEGHPNYTGEFSIIQFKYENIELGDLQGIASQSSTEEIILKTTLKNNTQDVSLEGQYYPLKEDGLDFKAKINSFDLKILESFTAETFENLAGNLQGEFSIKGSTSQPQIQGYGKFEKVTTKLKATGAVVRIQDQNATFTNQKVKFENFEILDSLKNKMYLSGQVDIQKLPDYTYDLKIRSKNFKIIDANEAQNGIYEGEGFVDTDLTIKGKNLNFKCSGDVLLNDKSRITLLSQQQSEVRNEFDNIITFIIKDPKNKTKKKIEKSSLNLANAININLEISEKAKLRMIMDPVTEDAMEVNGSGKLNIGYDNKGELFIVGRYSINKGLYTMTISVINKEFIIYKESQSFIEWNGNPLSGIMKITASHAVKGQIKVPFPENTNNGGVDTTRNTAFALSTVRIDLNMSQKLMEPKLEFDIVLKESDIRNSTIQNNSGGDIVESYQNFGYKILQNNNTIKDANSITIGEKQKSDMTNSAVSLLVSGALDTQSFLSNFSESVGMENMARQKISQILNSQINNYASSLVKFVDLNIGLDSKSIENLGSNTSLNLGVSKKLANERLILSFGKNFELESKKSSNGNDGKVDFDDIFDNLQADWLISKDGKFRFNMFRKSPDYIQIEGQVVETGAGFLISLDFETFKDLFKKSK
ncbi:MAG: translocation/assembly module TamB domain-containing protein [Leadbetterella sp.]